MGCWWMAGFSHLTPIRWGPFEWVERPLTSFHLLSLALDLYGSTLSLWLRGRRLVSAGLGVGMYEYHVLYDALRRWTRLGLDWRLTLFGFTTLQTNFFDTDKDKVGWWISGLGRCICRLGQVVGGTVLPCD